LDGQQWPTVEHYFQAQKFVQHDPEYAEQVRLAATPGAAKRMGRSRQHRVREDWLGAREPVMLTALRAKFTQHEPSRAVLLSTGGEELVEHAPWGDAYWGDGGNGTGRNRLGVLLMQVREELHA
jgi:hypothetical protein